jgi:hypothetical protein
MHYVYHAVAHQRVIHIVEAHCSKVVSTHATEFKLISRVFGHLHILEMCGRFPDNPKKRAALVLLFCTLFVLLRGHRVRVVLLRQGARGPNAHENEGAHY